MTRGFKAVKITATTDASGDATEVYPFSGFPALLYAVEWIDGDFADGVDAALSAVNTESGVDQELLDLTDANSDAWYYPRTTEDDESGSALTTTNYLVINGDLQLVIDEGGDTKTGGCIVYYLE